MPTLHHFPLDPFCRRIRLALGEYAVVTTMEEERPWEHRPGFLALNPAGEVPVFVDDDETVVCGILAVSEYLEETHGSGERTLLGPTPAARAETRRLVSWFDGRFNHEITTPVLMEKAVRRFLPPEMGGGPPDMERVRTAMKRLPGHLDYIARLAEERGLLAGDRPTMADLAAAAHISVLEYLDAVRWDGHESAKLWYQRIKSRPSFRPLLADRVRGINPPAVYSELDF